MQQQPNYQPPYPGNFGQQPVLVVSRTPFKVRLAVIALLLLITYIGFSVASPSRARRASLSTGS